jgi:hypothetical protein
MKPAAEPRAGLNSCLLIDTTAMMHLPGPQNPGSSVTSTLHRGVISILRLHAVATASSIMVNFAAEGVQSVSYRVTI